MGRSQRTPAGPRGAIGAAAESAAADHLRAAGWTVLGRNLLIGRDEVDILARDPADVIVVVEVRGRSGTGFGAPIESVDARKVARLYRAASSLRRSGHQAVPPGSLAGVAWRVDLLTLQRGPGDDWVVERHLQGLRPP
jgi:putative endonuclease